MASNKRYTVPRADGYTGVIKLQGYRLRIPAPSTVPSWDDDTTLSVLDDSDPGIRVVQGERPDSVGQADYRTRDGRRKIVVESAIIGERLTIGTDEDVAIYDRAGESGIRIVPADDDPFVGGDH